MSSEPPRAEAIKGAHQPYIPPDKVIREFSAKAVITGAILGILFALSSVYLALKVGLTVSASIPIAVLAITVFRWLKLNSTILENNIVQTTGSAGESIAAGIAFTLPSLLIMGFELELMRVLLVGLLGGLIGVLMMIPLRHGLIVKEHGKLSYPEGTACADVLIVGEQGGTAATTVFTGFFVGLGYAALNLIFKLWADTATFAMDMGGRLKKAIIAFEVSPPMLGVGYIIGPKVSANMLAGGMLAFVVLIPLIAQFGGPEVAAKSAYALRNDYVLYIGAGAVAAGGFIALARSIPTIITAFRRGLGNLRSTGAAPVAIPRTEQDLSMKIVLGGSALLAVAIFAAPILQIDFLTAVLVVLFGFFFVTVSSRITGEIGSSSNPISGMTIATLLLTCGLFVLLGRTGVGYKAMALTTAALVCVAASNGGTISQDLKTGFLVGATPKYQQIAILVGVVTSAILIGFTVLLLDGSVTTYQAVDYGTFSLPPANAHVHSIDEQATEGPTGPGLYHVATVGPGVTTPSGTAIPPGKYLTDGQGALTYSVANGRIAPVQYEGFRAPLFGVVVTTESAKGPDGKTYKVAFIQNDSLTTPDGAVIERGKYFVDDKGELMFFVHPGVVGTYPWKLKASSGTFPDLAVGVDHSLYKAGKTVGKNDGDQTGPDQKTYRGITLDAQADKLAPGHYLIDGDGNVLFKQDGNGAWGPVTGLAAPGWLAAAKDGTLHEVEGGALGTDEGKDLGLDRKAYRAANLSTVIGELRPGRYLMSDTNQIAYRSDHVNKYDAPKAQLFRLIIDGTLGGKLPWGLVLIGVLIAVILELLAVSSLPFAVGLYLPISTSAAIFVGGAIRWLVDRKRKGESASEAEFSPGMLMASGLIAGGAILGILQALVITGGDRGWFNADALDLSRFLPNALALNTGMWPMAMFLVMAGSLYWIGTRTKKK